MSAASAGDWGAGVSSKPGGPNPPAFRAALSRGLLRYPWKGDGSITNGCFSRAGLPNPLRTSRAHSSAELPCTRQDPDSGRGRHGGAQGLFHVEQRNRRSTARSLPCPGAPCPLPPSHLASALHRSNRRRVWPAGRRALRVRLRRGGCGGTSGAITPTPRRGLHPPHLHDQILEVGG